MGSANSVQLLTEPCYIRIGNAGRSNAAFMLLTVLLLKDTFINANI